MLKALAARRDRKQSDRGLYYKRSLILIFIVAGIPGLIIGALVHELAVGRMESALLQNHYRQIEQRSQNIDDQLGNLELLLSHWAFDSKFDYRLNGMDFVRQFETTQDLTKTLIAMQGSNAVVKQAELYAGGVLFNPEYERLDPQTAAAIYDPLVRGKGMTYWTRTAFDPKHPESKDLALVHHIPGGSSNPFGILVFRLDDRKMANMLKTMTPYDDGETILWERGGGIFASSGGSASNTPFVRALRDKIDASGLEKGLFFFKWEGTTYTVSYGNLDRIADVWTYVSASPISSITSPVVFVSKLIIAVSLVSLLIAALLAWLASHRIYSPVKRLVALLGGHAAADGRRDEFGLIERQWQHLHQESHALNAKLAEQLSHLKESFLHQLLQGYLYAYSDEDLLRRMERFKWRVNDRHFVVLYVRLVGMTSMDGKFKHGDEGLATFAAVNLIEELASQHFEQSDTINFHDLTAGILLIVPPEPSAAADIQAFCDELTLCINRMLKMRVAMAVSRTLTNISDVPLAFDGVKQAAGYRVFDNVNQMIDMEQDHSGGGAASEPQYPFALERELVQALRTGSGEHAREYLSCFLEAVSGNGAKEIDVQQGMLHLLGSIQHAVMASGIHPGRLFKGMNLYEALSQIREPKRMLEWFQEIVATPFLNELASRNNAQAKRMIEHAMIYLQTNYMNDISLDQCADRIGTNPFHLSRSFKQVTGTNFIDYLTELRLDKAKELLRESALKINDVACRVGYQHSYFNRIFKKTEGMTPTRYRELSQSS